MYRSLHSPPMPGMPGKNPSYAELKAYVDAHGLIRASYRFNLAERYIEERLALGEVPPEVIIVDAEDPDEQEATD